MSTLKEKARKLKGELYAVYLACRDRRTPWYAKAIILLIVVYAASPIDLIPDFIPVLGYLDDLIIIPAGIYLALKMIPVEVMEECRGKAGEPLGAKTRWAGAGIIIALWLLALYLVIRFTWRIVT
ncbi:MAG: YkvA family protein [Dehalococcoidales bacterium]|nr:YkvA family protein [Dehalococcoidales bacterium]